MSGIFNKMKVLKKKSQPGDLFKALNKKKNKAIKKNKLSTAVLGLI